MIREISAQTALHCRGSMAAIYIVSLAVAYGEQASFVRYYGDDKHIGYLAIMDGVGYYHSPHAPSAEWLQFLSMVPDMEQLYTSVCAAEHLATVWHKPFYIGHLLRHNKNVRGIDFTDIKIGLCAPEKLHDLLCQCFENMPAFASWYVDVSHRVRHGISHVATEWRGEQCIGCAMTVAETPGAVLVGAVCTLPQYRGQGVASRCLTALLHELNTDRAVYLTVQENGLVSFYEKQGFSLVKQWARIAR